MRTGKHALTYIINLPNASVAFATIITVLLQEY